MSRIVRLLDPPELTWRQRAQRKYRQSAKGEAAHARSRAKRLALVEVREQEAAYKRLWVERNRVQLRVYNRTWQRTSRRLKLAA